MKLGSVAIAATTAALSLVVGGCSGAPPTQNAGVVSFAGAPFESVVSASGALHVALRAWPETPVVGDDAFELSVTDASGAPALGVTATVIPWMPAHGHGTSVQPIVSGEDPGVFVAQPVDLYMSGRWELRITFSGQAEDAATAIVDLP